MDSEAQADTGTAEAPAADVAVESGQGQGGTTEGLYEEILTSAPEELRPQLQEHLKKIDGNVTRKFQEYAEKLKQYEAFDGIDLADLPAEDLQGLLDFRNLASDPEQFESWWEQVGTEMGFLEGEGADGDDLEAAPDGEVEDEIPAWAQPLLEFVQQSQERETQTRAQSEQAERVRAARESLEPRLQEVTEQHGLNDKAQAAVLRFARDHVETDDDPIGRGLEDYLQLTGAAQSELVEDRLGQPDGATSGGRPPATETAPKSFKDARAAAMQRMGAGA